MKKFLSLLLSVVLLITALPVSSQAAFTVPEEVPQNTDNVSSEMMPEAAEGFGSINQNIFDQAEILNDYLNRKIMDASVTPTYGTIAGNNLTGVNRRLYDVCKEGVARVAAGLQTSTSFTLTPEQVGLGSTSWTFNELGIPESSSYSEVSEAINRVIGQEPYQVLNALLRDCPYEMYWFGLSFSWSTLQPYIYTQGGVKRVRLDGVVGLAFSVYETFRGSSQFSVNSSQTARVTAAISNARSLIQENAGRTDAEKLRAYFEYLCTHNEYNYAAAAGNEGSYGDPWQIIYMFDNDLSTKVVCEGYAKGFQYLCDNSSFTGNIYAISVTGDAGGAHMWNIVHLDDGANYHLDATFADQDGYIADEFYLAQPISCDPALGYVISAWGTNHFYEYYEETLSSFTAEQLTLLCQGEDPTPTPPGLPTIPGANGLMEVSGQWILYENGHANTAYTGLTLYNNNWFFVRDGVLDRATNGLIPFEGNQFLISDGVIQRQVSGLVEIGGQWYYMSEGVVQQQYTGLTEYNGIWFFLNNGRIDYSYEGIILFEGNYFVINDGIINRNVNGFYELQNGPGLGRDWYLVSDGVIQQQYNDLVEYQNNYFYLRKGRLDRKFQGVVSFQGHQFYVADGYIRRDFTGNYAAGGLLYTVVEGVVTQSSVAPLASGQCGDDVFWNLYPDNTMTIYGSGPMWNFNHEYEICYENPFLPYCETLRELIIDEGVTSVSSRAFEHFTALERVSLPQSLLNIENFAFLYCTSLSYCPLPRRLETLGQQAFDSCRITSVDIPSTVYCLDEPYRNNHELTSVIIRSDENLSAFIVSNAVFSNCHSLESIEVEPGHLALESIDGVLYLHDSFSPDLTLLQYPSGKKNTEFVISSSVNRIYQMAFEECLYLKTVIVPSTVTELMDHTFWNNPELETVIFQGSITSLPESVFSGNVKLRNIVFPSGLTSIGESAFLFCNSLETLTIPDGVTSLGTGALQQCENLRSVTIPEGMTELPGWLFGVDTNLRSVTLPGTLTRISENVFYECSSLSDIYFNGTATQWQSIYIDPEGNEALQGVTIHFLR